MKLLSFSDTHIGADYSNFHEYINAMLAATEAAGADGKPVTDILHNGDWPDFIDADLDLEVLKDFFTTWICGLLRHFPQLKLHFDFGNHDDSEEYEGILQNIIKTHQLEDRVLIHDITQDPLVFGHNVMTMHGHLPINNRNPLEYIMSDAVRNQQHQLKGDGLRAMHNGSSADVRHEEGPGVYHAFKQFLKPRLGWVIAGTVFPPKRSFKDVLDVLLEYAPEYLNPENENRIEHISIGHIHPAKPIANEPITYIWPEDGKEYTVYFSVSGASVTGGVPNCALLYAFDEHGKSTGAEQIELHKQKDRTPQDNALVTLAENLQKFFNKEGGMQSPLTA